MPTYLYLCPSCGTKREVFKPLRLLDEAVSCACSSAMERQISAPFVRGDYAGYSCPITGKWVEGKRAHEENLRRQGCRLWEPGETQAVQARRAAEEAAEDAALEASIEEEIAKLPSDKRERLGAEMEHGITAEVVRAPYNPT